MAANEVIEFGRFTLRARLIEYRDLACDVRHFVFEVPETERLAFAPGQFLSFMEQLEGKMVTRAYSIASPPDGNRFDLCLNRVKEGLFSPHLFHLEPGDEVEAKGPYGTFALRHPASDSVMIATGTGIAPFRSILLSQVPSDTEHQYTLLFGVRYEETLLYREEFEALGNTRPNFRFWPTLTRPEPKWTGRVGRVQQHLLEALEERRDIDVYICGLKEMVNDIRARLKELGFERQRIIYEKYD